jgi:hypothetical protein
VRGRISEERLAADWTTGIRLLAQSQYYSPQNQAGAVAHPVTCLNPIMGSRGSLRNVRYSSASTTQVKRKACHVITVASLAFIFFSGLIWYPSLIQALKLNY